MSAARWWPLIALAMAALPLGCGGDGGAPSEEAGADAADAGDGQGSGSEPARFEQVVYTHEQTQERTGIATGDYLDPALSYPPIPVPEGFSHAISFTMEPFMPPVMKALPTHGPLILYDDAMNVLVFSPMDHFFTSLVSVADGEISYGVPGEVDSLPAGFIHRFVLVRGEGMAATLEHWGDVLLADRGRERHDRYADPGLSYLGYWTDNGAYYYYETEGALNEQDTLLAVAADADARGLPYGYFQLDSWWYFKEQDAGLFPPAGLMAWEPQPEKFPEGLAAFREALGLPLVAHNRWVAAASGYVDDFDMVVEEPMALPRSRDLYDVFMADAARWGIVTYEQDWLMNQFWGLGYLREAPDRAETSMGFIDSAAREQGLTVQLCMAGAAHLMDALDRPATTTVRTSTDYRRDLSKETYWPQFHTVNMLAWALGVWPFKDNFQAAEDYGEAEALISALSGGMVGVGDRIGAADPAIVGRTCRSDGLLLKPDRPALPLDAMFLPHARPFTTATYSDRPGLGRWTYLAAYHLAAEHPDRDYLDRFWARASYSQAAVDEMFVFPDEVSDWSVDLPSELDIEGQAVAYDWRKGTASLVSGTFDLPSVARLYGYSYVVFAPVLANGLALIGEPAKYVTLADRRFAGIEVQGDSLEVTLAGAPGEEVEVLAFDARAGGLLPPARGTIGEDGEGAVVIGR